MSFLKMLEGFEATPNEKKESTRAKIQRNPITADLRVFKTGAVYPSADCVTSFNLQYHMKESEVKGNGFDVIDSRELQNTKGAATPFLMIAPVSKDAGRVDLFNQTMFNEDGTPIANVMDQGSTSFGEEMLRMLKEVYGITFEGEDNFVDLTFEKVDVISTQLQNATNGIYYVPKRVTRGPLKGTMQYTRRENLDIYVLVPANLVNDNATITKTATTTTTPVGANSTVNS